MECPSGTVPSIYTLSRTIKRKGNTLYNALRSIHEDSIFVGEISQLWPELPLLANLRCGLWYFQKFDSTCYFKSTDGHTNNLSFNTSRLNLHVALLAGQRGGCMIVDSTRKGKRFPDSMSKTIPVWTCVLNRAILNYKKEVNKDDGFKDIEDDSLGWDCSLHLPLWISGTEREMIEKRLESWIKDLESSGADIASIASCLRKPLRPLWISHRTVIWLNEVPEYDSWDFTPVILISASSSDGNFQHLTTSEFSWNYIPGAGDDEESWARGLTPNLFWKHSYDIISSGPDVCNKKIAEIVEKDRVCRVRRGEHAPQVSVRPSKFAGSTNHFFQGTPRVLDDKIIANGDNHRLSFLGSTNIAVGTTQLAMESPNDFCILNCDKESFSVSMEISATYLHLPIVDSKFDCFSLSRNLPHALDFAEKHLRTGKRLLVCCSTGEDISVCVCLAILISFYNESGCFDEGKSFNKGCITKLYLRRRLVFICKFAPNARPSRGNLKQVFNYLNGGCIRTLS